ncbi:helix-turn-helix transcriptional regulator [Pseudanabaena yagii]|uniref:Helix-turn-helix transcriptional regulator n=1 Tax=Pseudanabaena yagii GIHE-NHR1 TaxID=2722753 RepID=A0ABX1LP37_9CYAN|nr:helix-turn-helix transcriptional regulator [Pseudanabaena yagii]NMF57890.1 helix-turn-helix transcriptional regulator [Pseudanabaena yagii GIHE-NHR1]
MDLVKKISPYAELMARNGVTQAQIADSLGYSRQSVNSWFTGKVDPKLTLREWRKLASLLGTSLDHLPDSFAPQPIDQSQQGD